MGCASYQRPFLTQLAEKVQFLIQFFTLSFLPILQLLLVFSLPILHFYLSTLDRLLICTFAIRAPITQCIARSIVWQSCTTTSTTCSTKTTAIGNYDAVAKQLHFKMSLFLHPFFYTFLAKHIMQRAKAAAMRLD